MFQQIQHLDREIAGAQQHIGSFENREHNMLAEIQALERQKDALTRQIEFA
jgi:chromosome segregation ATPase